MISQIRITGLCVCVCVCVCVICGIMIIVTFSAILRLSDHKPVISIEETSFDVIDMKFYRFD